MGATGMVKTAPVEKPLFSPELFLMRDLPHACEYPWFLTPGSVRGRTLHTETRNPSVFNILIYNTYFRHSSLTIHMIRLLGQHDAEIGRA